MKGQLFKVDNIRCLRSENYNWSFNTTTGEFARWGKTFDDDPSWSPFGPEIADIEISKDGCPGYGTSKMPKCCRYCSPAGTRIDTPNGPIPIETVRPGTAVFGHNGSGIVEQTVAETYARQYEGELVELVLETGEILRLTPDHVVFMADGSHTKAGSLAAGDEVLGL